MGAVDRARGRAAAAPARRAPRARGRRGSGARSLEIPSRAHSARIASCSAAEGLTASCSAPPAANTIVLEPAPVSRVAIPGRTVPSSHSSAFHSSPQNSLPSPCRAGGSARSLAVSVVAMPHRNELPWGRERAQGDRARARGGRSRRLLWRVADDRIGGSRAPRTPSGATTAPSCSSTRSRSSTPSWRASSPSRRSCSRRPRTSARPGATAPASGRRSSCPRARGRPMRSPTGTTAQATRLPGGLEAVHAPGPEQPHYALLLERGPGVLFCPDQLMRGPDGELLLVPGEFHEDPAETRRTVERCSSCRSRCSASTTARRSWTIPSARSATCSPRPPD